MDSQVTSDIPREIEELLVDIKYISGLPPSHKYDIKSQAYSHATSLFSRAYRSLFTSEDKVKALNFINRTITSAILLARKYPKWQQSICRELSLLTDAITNLKHVYSGEPKFIARLSTAEIKIQPDAFMNACSISPSPPAIFVERSAPIGVPFPEPNYD